MLLFSDSWQIPVSSTLLAIIILSIIGHIAFVAKVKKLRIRDLFTNTTIVKDVQGGGVNKTE